MRPSCGTPGSPRARSPARRSTRRGAAATPWSSSSRRSRPRTPVTSTARRPRGLMPYVLLPITTDREPASDLGWLLHKHPGRLQTFSQPAGQAHVFYAEATDARTTAALVLEVDPVALVRGKKGTATEAFAL